jgi:CHASE1-domain containing sensor protein
MNPRRLIIRCWEFLVRMPRMLPLLVFAATLFLTISSTIAFERSEHKTQQLRLQVKADDVAASLEQNMATNVAVLRSGRSLYSALGTVDRETFKRFVEELQVNRATIGVRAVGWSVALNGNDVAALENDVRRQDIPDFRVWPKAAGSSSKTHIILYLEPMSEQNKKALGYNMYSDPTRRRAMQTAARSGLAVASETVVLVQDRKQPKLGFLVYVPVYKGDCVQRDPRFGFCKHGPN